MAQAIALVIFHDHRESSVEAAIKRLPPEVMKNVAGVTIKVLRRLHQLFGERPYHVLLDLEAKDGDTLVHALEYIEDHFSHVDGFM